jgi:(p)ppGpp synthase/HD superfamily hydrolase
MIFDVDRYVALLQFAAHRHGEQKTPANEQGRTFPYVVHITTVTAEVIAVLPVAKLDADLAVGCALLHDTIEDSAGDSYEEKLALADEIERTFGRPIRDGVWALTKLKSRPDGMLVDKPAQMADSMRRIREQPHEVWAVKLADRITNLQPPPKKWSRQKCETYLAEAQQILATLGAGCPVLAERLAAKIAAYPASWNR